MMQKPISDADVRMAAASSAVIPVRVTIVTLDGHMASALERARRVLLQDMPGLELTLHAATEMGGDVEAMERCRKDIADADVVIAHMIFLEDQINMIKPWLDGRRDHCDAMVGCLAAAEIVKLTKLGDFEMSKPTGGALGFLKRLRGKSKSGGSGGQSQMKLLRQLPKLLKFIPGKAQDVRAYFLTMQYLLAGSEDNIVNLVRFLVGRYATGPRRALRNRVGSSEPIHYPDVGLYGKSLAHGVGEDLDAYRAAEGSTPQAGTVGVLVMRSYVLANNTAHYAAVIAALRAKGLNVITAFASGLDGRPAIERYFMKDGVTTVDAVLSLTGFSLVGGPAYNDASAAEDMLARLDVPYLSAFASEFQSLQKWGASNQGLTPVEATIMVSLPEIDGASGPILFGGRNDGSGVCRGCDRNCAFDNGIDARDMQPCLERADMLAARLSKMVRLRRKAVADRRVSVVIYNFPPNGGATGTAAYLGVFHSLFNTLSAMKAQGYDVDLPTDADALRHAILDGNAQQFGQAANIAARVDADTHVRRERWLADIEAAWGPAPGKTQTDGRDIFILGANFGKVFVGVQPPFGYEGDPMRLLFENGFAPTHAFSAFYTYLREDLDVDAVVHFGTHGALEFMPGKQTGLTADCWPDRLIGDLPNIYLYAANNPSEGALAKRRSAATLVSHLTPPVAKAGLYKGFADLKATIDRYRSVTPDKAEERIDIAQVIRSQAEVLDLVDADSSPWFGDAAAEILALTEAVREMEMSLIPHGLHVVGNVMDAAQRLDLLISCNVAAGDDALPESLVEAIAAGRQVLCNDHQRELVARLETLNTVLKVDHETPAILHALNGGYIRPVSGGDVVRAPEIAPTGRNIHGFDPFRLPSAYACADGAAQAELLIQRYRDDHDGAMPKRIAMVLWGTDNLKSEGAPIAQTLALVGAKPRFDSFGRLAGADLIALEELGRARIDVVVTLSGIFRDLLPLQTKLLAEAFLKAAKADDEPLAMNPIRAHALEYMAEHDCEIETAALRVFSNAAGAYGSNVNLLIDSGVWDHEDELADAYSARKGFAYGVDGKPVQRSDVLNSVLASVEMAYQNIESVELGITTVDHYFDTLGGISQAIRKNGGGRAAVYVGDQTAGKAKVRTLSEQVTLESRTRTLNPKFYEALLDHGYEGVRQIEAQVTNTMGWSATTGEVAPWIYQDITETFVLDAAMRDRLAKLNPKASAKLANRLIEASDRNFWQPDEATLAALLDASDELEDRLEGIVPTAADSPAALEAAE